MTDALTDADFLAAWMKLAEAGLIGDDEEMTPAIHFVVSMEGERDLRYSERFMPESGRLYGIPVLVSLDHSALLLITLVDSKPLNYE